MTSIEWLVEQINKHWDNKNINSDELIKKAKEMHKAEILAAANTLLYHSTGPGNTAAETYYQETFVSKGSDEHHEDNLVEIPTSSQTEISDEEIEKAMEKHINNDLDLYESLVDGHISYNTGIDLLNNLFIAGAKWYREQLKQKQYGKTN